MPCASRTVNYKLETRNKKLRSNGFKFQVSSFKLKTGFTLIELLAACRPKSSLTRRRKAILGFTLIELLVVIAIIGLLAAIGTASFSKAQEKGRDTRRKTDLDAIKKALELFKLDTVGQYYYPEGPYAANILAPTYIKTMPYDPKTPTEYYYWNNGCAANLCSGEYRLRAILENTNDPQIAQSQSKCPPIGGLVYNPNEYWICPN